jgi:transcriptional antiterminator RfaH
MPILSAETTVYPDSLLEEVCLQPSDRCWWVLYTKARQEKAIARDLLNCRIPFYLPQVEKTSFCRGRRIRSFIPLFAGYVFLFGSVEERTRSLMTNRISRVLTIDDPDRLVYDLRQLRKLIASDAPLTIESRLVPGDRVRVRYGSLEGLEGTVLARRGRTRLLVAVDFLQQGASVEVEDFLLEPTG